MVLILEKRLFLVLKKKRERKWREVREENKRGRKRTWDTCWQKVVREQLSLLSSEK